MHQLKRKAFCSLHACFDPRRNIMPVKIRKGLSAKLMLETTDMATTLTIFGDAIEALADKIVPTDPSASDTIERVQTIKELIVSTFFCRQSCHACVGSIGRAENELP
jgi:hypothetical protein